MKLHPTLVIGFFCISLSVFGYIVFEHAKYKIPRTSHTQQYPIVRKSVSNPIVSSSSQENFDTISEPAVQYISGICGSEVPSTWHTRTSEDQRVWNTEGNVLPPSELSAEDFFVQFSGNASPVFSPPFKPALFSIAAGDTPLNGHVDDPGAEDGNRLELDVLSLSEKEMQLLLKRIQDPPPGYTWQQRVVDNQSLRVLQNTDANDKYHGQELIFVPIEKTKGSKGIIFYNRSNAWTWDMQAMQFRTGVDHFLQTMNLAECPREWFN